MLASTVQFSTYNQTPTPLHRQTRDLPQEAQRYEEQTGPDREETTPAGVPPGRARSLRTQQRAYEPDLRLSPRSTPRRAVLAAADDAGRTGQCSTLEHHPGHCAAIRDWMTVLARARLWTTRTNLAASAP